MANYNLKIKKKKQIAESTLAVWFDTSGINFTFKPGQYADFTLYGIKNPDEKGNTRTFSIASSPNHEDFIMIATRIRGSAFKKFLEKSAEGTETEVSGPMGSFTLHSDESKPAVLIAGGMGVTPFRSMVEYCSNNKISRKIYMFMSNRTPELSPFLNEFEVWTEENRNFELIPTITQSDDLDWPYEKGRVDKEMLQRSLPDLNEPIYYIAGPPGMVSGISEMLIEAGVSEDNIRSEDFAGY